MTDKQLDTDPICPGAAGGEPANDLAWLLNRAAQLFRAALGRSAAARGLEGVRDYEVLSSLSRDAACTQAELGQRLGVDKTTLTAVLDRLERAAFIVRRIDPDNRRARFPEVTEAGRQLQQQVDAEHLAVEAKLLAGMSHDEQTTLRRLLNGLVATGERQGVHLSGSCM